MIYLLYFIYISQVSKNYLDVKIVFPQYDLPLLKELSILASGRYEQFEKYDFLTNRLGQELYEWLK